MGSMITAEVLGSKFGRRELCRRKVLKEDRVEEMEIESIENLTCPCLMVLTQTHGFYTLNIILSFIMEEDVVAVAMDEDALRWYQ